MDVVSQFAQAVSSAYTWATTVGILITAALLAISLIAWIYSKA